MSDGLPTDLDTAAGALKFADLVFDSAKTKFDERGSVGAASFLLVSVDPATDEPFEDGPKISVVEGSDFTVEQHEKAVRGLAQKYRAVGVLTMTECRSSAKPREVELTDNEDLNEFLGEVVGREERDTTDTDDKPVVMIMFEHLKFAPRVRVWVAPVLTVGDDRVLGAFEEDVGGDRSVRFGTFLTFYN